MFVSEIDLVRSFAERINDFPIDALMPGSSRLLIIGNELHLPGAGAGGSGGSADIVAVDDQGEVWLIEAKLARNPQINPHYVFGNQLCRYATSFSNTGIEGLHSHFQDYAFGRRSSITPPAALTESWSKARSLRDMLATWLVHEGLHQRNADELLATICQRVRTGNFVLAVLTDHAQPELIGWARTEAGRFQSAIIRASQNGVEVLYRTPSVSLAVDEAGEQSLPPFSRIPQSFKPLPNTLPRVLSPMAFSLYADIVRPRLEAILGDLSTHRPEQSSTSFGFSFGSSTGLPFFVRIGRGDKHLHEGSPSGTPGNHALKVDIVLKWACDSIFALATTDPLRVTSAQSLQRLARNLVDNAGYRFKNATHEQSRLDFSTHFSKGLSERTLMLEHGGKRGGPLDFGENESSASNDAYSLNQFFDSLERELPMARPIGIRPRPKRFPYARGKLSDMTEEMLMVVPSP